MKKQSSGLYRTKVTIGHDSKGKPIVKWISAKTKRELEYKKREVVEYYINGTGTAGDVMFAPYARKWLHVYKSNRAPSTIRAYDYMIEHYLVPVFGDRQLRSITASDIQAFYNTLEGKCESIIRHSYGVLLGIYKAAIRDRIVDRNPAEFIEKPSPSKVKDKHVLTKAERKKLESVIATSEYGLLVGMIYYTGMRIGEACGIQWGDINWKDNLIHIQRNIDYTNGEIHIGTLKTKSSNRYVPIAAPLLKLLKSIPIGMPTAYIFTGYRGGPMPYYTAKRNFSLLMLEAGMAHKEGKKIITDFTAHNLRHNFITICYEKGIDAFTASKLAGHSNSQVTTNIYTHLSKEHIKELAPAIEKMFN